MYVDDLLIVRNNKKKIKKIKIELTKNFKFIKLKTTKLYLKVEFEYIPCKIWFYQRAYIFKLFNKYDMTTCILAKISIDPNGS